MPVHQKQLWILSACFAIINADQSSEELTHKAEDDKLLTNATLKWSRCSKQTDCQHTEVCIDGVCECDGPYARFDPYTDSCIACACKQKWDLILQTLLNLMILKLFTDEGYSCTTCCASFELDCFESVCRKCLNDHGENVCE